MNLIRIFQTVRHLSLSQLAYRPVCRGKFLLMEGVPNTAHAYFRRRAGLIGRFNFADERLEKAVSHVVQLQRAVHGEFLDGLGGGRFTLLNREIDFGSLCEVEWRRELGERNNRLWRMNLSYMGYLVPLVEARGVEAIPIIESLLTSMTAQNPWSSPGVFRDIWHPYSVSHRVINLVTCLSLFDRQGVKVHAATRELIESEIRLGTSFLLGNLERDLQYNHLFKNFVCLAVVAATQTDAFDFASGPLREVPASIAQQFLSDGGHAERAPMYHLLALIDLRVLRDSGVLPAAGREAVRQAICGAENAANVVSHPDGDVAIFNDSWLGEAPAAFDLTDAVVQRPKEFQRYELPDFGYARMAKDGDSVVFDYGACGPDANPGHAHADFLSLELSVGGVRAIVDPGVPTYSEGEARNSSRSASFHNGPCVSGLEPIEFWSSFRVGRRGYAYPLALSDAAGPAVAGWHDGYIKRGLRVARGVRLYPGSGLLVVDLWQGKSGLPEQSGFLVSGRAHEDDAYSFNLDTQDGPKTFSISMLYGATSATEPASYYLKFGLPVAGRKAVFNPASINDTTRCLALWFSWGDDTSVPTQDWEMLSRELAASLASRTI